MSGNEVAAILALMSAAWPAATVNENTARVWGGELTNIHGEDALAATHTLIRTSKFFPSVAEFLDVVRPLTARRARADQAADYERKALAEGGTVSDPEDGRAGVSRHIRSILAAQAGRRHWHGGPNPCPTCGGITTDPKTLERYARSGGPDPTPVLPTTSALDDGWIEDAKNVMRENS